MSRRRPAKRFRGIEPRWSGAHQAWRWRARVVVEGKARVGPWQETQEQAFEDRELLKLHRGAYRAARCITLGTALDGQVAAARKRGVLDRTLNHDYVCRTRFLESMLGPSSPLSQVADVDRVLEFIRAAKANGRKPQTIRRDLWLLSRAFKAASLPNVIDEARDEVRNTLKSVPARTRFLTPSNVQGILRKVRALCEPDADLLELLYVTGVRAGELGRVTLDDVELDQLRFHVREPKDRSNPRVCELPASSIGVLQRMVERARLRPDSGPMRSRTLVPNSENEVRNVCRRWKRELELDALSGRILRHSFGTAAMLVGGAAMNEVMGLVGHKRAATTSRYLHAIGERRREIVDRIGEVLEGGQEEE